MSVKLLREALSVKDLYEAGWTREEIAEDTAHAPAWVQVRCMILDLDVEVRKLFMEHDFTIAEVRRLYKWKNDVDKQRDLAQSLIDVKARKAEAKKK